MATGKRYYWIKIRDSFFTSDTVDFFMSQPNGAQYIVLYQMLHLLTANTGGKLQRQIGEIIIPYDVAKIERDCKWFSEDTIRVALELYKKFGLVYEGVDGALVLSDHDKMVGSETDYAEKQRLYRNEQKMLESGSSETKTGYNVSDNVSYNVDRNVPLENRDKILETRIPSKENNKKKVPLDTGAESTKESEYDEETLKGFERFWKIYSVKRKDTRSESLRCFHARMLEGFSPDYLCECAQNYVDQCNRDHTQSKYVLMPKTFLGPNHRFLAYEPKKQETHTVEDELPSGLIRLHFN